MTKYIKEYEKRAIISSGIMIFIASLLIVEPAIMLNTIVTIFGFGILIDGILSTILYIFIDKEHKMYSNALAEGVLEIIAAVLILLNKTFMISIIPVLIGIWIIVKSIIKLQLSLNIKSEVENSWMFILISSIITLAIGLISIIHPFDTMVTITVLSGILLLVSGVISIIESIYILINLKQ